MTLRFTLRQLEYFVAVGEAGSIVLASAKVNVSSPSISAAISQLESEFGLSLFVRKHAHGLSLTPAGKELMLRAKALLDDADQLNSVAGDISGKIRGPLSIGCLLTFAQLIVPNLRRKFEEKYPEVQVSQSELFQSDIFDRLRQAEIDIALTYDLDIPSDLVFVPLAELPPYALVGEEHPLVNLPAVSVDELKDYPMVLLDLPHSSTYFMSFFSEIGVKPQIAERTKDMAVMRSLVANGYGYSIANVRPLNDLSPDGRKLRFIPLLGDVRPMKMGLVMTQGAKSILTVQAFAEHCKETITQSSVPGLNVKKSD
ncbi:LysR family transcriptional regulator [Cochlodiniinecator piscidefendens]|uniref:LysR family transcriptional regulator n=1 Tax=Cochlodiniinecator piscidefendens TaxID=2715756 RepID=UPI00140A422B|nr:LysR family transcriptional regulator [Cochlodiniinecator piscidefendens]